MCRRFLRVPLGLLIAACVIQNGCGSKDGTIPPIADTTPPAAVTNLSATPLAPDSVRLTWTAPGDDSAVGTASLYDVPYSTSAITELNWSSAAQATDEPTPHAAGTQESFMVTGLQVNTTYHFACKTADDVPNWSALSNVVSATVGGDNTPPSRVTDLAISSWTARRRARMSSPPVCPTRGRTPTPAMATSRSTHHSR